MIALVLMTVWGWLGFDTIIYLAALQGVPHELLEAASIDGATRWSSFWRVTWPMLGPATLLLVVWSTISALQLFDEVFFVTHGGPLGRTSVVVFYVYRLAFEQGLGSLSLAGYAAAIAYVLFLVILLLTLAQFWLGRRVVHYSS
jgi:multiple sugar transport system permease protein